MAEPEEILYACQRALGPADLAGRRLLITAGPTREALDPIRFLSNRSSGKMGYALAAAAARRGAEVVLVSGPTALETPYGVERVDVVSAAEMAAAVERRLGGCQALIMAAAVADYRPRRARRTKIKKADGGLAVDWVRTRDILAGLGRRKGRRVLVGFAAETGDPVAAARHKLEAKKLDLVVANDVSRPDAGFAVDGNRASLVDRQGVERLEHMPKDELADRILERLLPLLPEQKGRKRR
jgi:phosphopantothenoylcysteine decarboxylase/phosphopantothenate--cysteine ligase